MSVLATSLPIRTLVASLLLGAAAFGHAQYRVAAYEDTPGFDAIVERDSAAAKRAIPYTSTVVPTYALDANRCVSQVLDQSLDDALLSCNRALGRASASGTHGAFSVRDRKATRSMLLSNRGVVLALRGELVAAEEDFRRAVKLDRDNDNAVRNLAYVEGVQLGQR